MKLAIILGITVATLGSTSALAGHHGHRNCSHDNRAEYHYDKAEKHLSTAHRLERKSRHDRGRHHDRDRYGQVVDVEPVYRYYKEPVNAHSCVRMDDMQPSYRSYTSVVMGAVIGGALGHRIGDAHGDPTAAAVAGGLLGASVGRDIGRRISHNQRLRVEGPCRIQQHEQTRRQLVEYKVSYRYNGRVHHARMDYDPGDWVKLDVDITPA